MKADYQFLPSKDKNNGNIIKNNTKIWSVSQLSTVIKSLLEKNFANVYLKGEVSQLYYHKLSGHLYFTLKDEKAVISCVLFKNVLQKLDFEIEVGLNLLVQGTVAVYPPRGSYQIILSQVFIGDRGILDIRFEQLQKKLASEGLFDEINKQKIPYFIRKVGIIAGWQSDALKDIINISKERFPKIEYFVLPASVSGAKSASAVLKALKLMDKNAKKLGLDVIIIARGGGSKEDMQGFNEETLVRGIYNCKTPIISAIGHQQNISLSDMVADKKAATPSEAAVMITPQTLTQIQEKISLSKISITSQVQKIISQNKTKITHSQQLLNLNLKNYYQKVYTSLNHALLKLSALKKQPQSFKKLSKLKILLHNQVTVNLTNKKHAYLKLKTRIADVNPQKQLKLCLVKLSYMIEALNAATRQKTSHQKMHIDSLKKQLRAHNPRNIMKKGYTLVSTGKKIISLSSQAKNEQLVTITWHDGAKTAIIKHKKSKNELGSPVKKLN